MDRAPAILLPRAANDATSRRRKPVALAVPSHDHLHANFAMALASLMFYCGLKDIPVGLVNAKGSLVQKNRNNAVAWAQANDCEAILFVDSDLTFPPQVLERLLAHERDIVGATYARRTPPHSNLAKPKGGRAGVVNGLVEVDALPTGCLLIRMGVFEKLVRPYFRCGAVAEGETWEGLSGPMDTGEDYNFCIAARRAGFSIWMDTELSFELVHWGEIGYRLAEGDAADASRFETVELAP